MRFRVTTALEPTPLFALAVAGVAAAEEEEAAAAEEDDAAAASPAEGSPPTAGALRLVCPIRSKTSRRS